MRMLTLYTLTGCESCKDALPDFFEFSKHHGLQVLCKIANITVRLVSPTGFEPKLTPTYELSEGKETIKIFEGPLTEKGINDFVFGEKGKSIRKRRN